MAAHPSVPFGPKLRAHMTAGQITRLCECGCNSFDIEIPDAVMLEPLYPAIVLEGKVVLEGEPLTEGAVVTVVARGDDDAFDVSPEEERALLDAMAQADRGQVVSWEVLREQMRRTP